LAAAPRKTGRARVQVLEWSGLPSPLPADRRHGYSDRRYVRRSSSPVPAAGTGATRRAGAGTAATLYRCPRARQGTVGTPLADRLPSESTLPVQRPGVVARAVRGAGSAWLLPHPP